MKYKSKDLTDLFKEMANYISLAEAHYNKLTAKISANILKTRVNMGMNQVQFAKYMNVSQGMVSKWESGDYNFTIKSLCEIGEKLNLDLDITVSKMLEDKPKENKNAFNWMYAIKKVECPQANLQLANAS